MTDPRRAKITDEDRAESARLKAIWDSKTHRTQAEFGEHYSLGNQGNVGHYLNGRSRLNIKSATAFAIELQCDVSDFSPRLATQIEDLSKSVKQTPPVFVVTPQTAVVENLRMRPALKRVMVETFKSLAGQQSQVQEEFRLGNDQVSDIAILGMDGKPKVLIECKTFKPALHNFYKPAYLAGECWLTKHDANGQPMQDGPKLFHIGLLENSNGKDEPGQAVTKLQSSYRLLRDGTILDGFALMRVADMPNGETLLYDLPDTPETMALLLEQVKQAAQ